MNDISASPQRATVSEYARIRGVTPSFVCKLRRQGRLVLDDHGKIIVEASNYLIAAKKHPTNGGAHFGPRAKSAGAEQAIKRNAADALIAAGEFLVPALLGELARLANCATGLAALANNLHARLQHALATSAETAASEQPELFSTPSLSRAPTPLAQAASTQATELP